MDKYKKLKAVQGLITSLDEQIYRYQQAGWINLDAKENEEKLINQYYDAILELLNEKA